MTKKEKEYLEHLEVRLALRFTGDGPILPDVAPPDFGCDPTSGFLFNSHSIRVYPAWSFLSSHVTDRIDGSRSQGGRWLFSTRDLAFQAMRRELEMRFAKELRRVDVLAGQ